MNSWYFGLYMLSDKWEGEFYGYGIDMGKAIVVEYALSETEVKKNLFEDGDLFYLNELDEEQMLQVMIQEIEA